MSYTNILSRRLPYELINLGFSGNGKGEPELARIICEIERPALLVLDYKANVSIEQYRETLPEFIRLNRVQHPDTPVLIISRIRYAEELFSEQAVEKRLAYSDFAEQTVARLRLQGDNHIYFQNGDVLLGEDFEECTVDGVHPTDLGFIRMADGLTPILTMILGESCNCTFHK